MTLPDRKSSWPALTLALISPILTELFSGNIPATIFFRPWVYAALILIYGLPALIIRELYLSWNLKLPGLFLLGLAYGIFNEGVCAKTLLLDQHVPIDAFAHHAWLGVNFPWAFLIVPWHALHAIIFPIALVTRWFPADARTRWIPSWLFWAGASFLIAIGTLVHLTNKNPVSSPLYLVFLEAVMAALIILAKNSARAEPFLEPGGSVTWRAVLTGFTFYPVFVLSLSIAAGAGWPNLVICVAALLLLGFYWRLLARSGWLSLTPFVLCALGDYLAGSILTGLGALRHAPVISMTEAALAGFFIQRIYFLLRETRAPALPVEVSTKVTSHHHRHTER